MSLKTCKECKKEISDSARKCPQCGAYQWTRVRIGCLGAVGLFCIIPIIFAAVRSCRNDTPTDKSIQSAQASDQVQQIIQKYGKPDIDKSTQNDKPRPPIVTRWIVYKKENVRFSFVPDTKAEDPPPYHRWKIVGITDANAKKVIAPEEADQRLLKRKK